MNHVPFRKIQPRNLAYVLLAAMLAVTVSIGFAHTELVSATPAANSTVKAPKEVAITFSGALEPKFSKITVMDASGNPVTKEASAVGANMKLMTLALPVMAPGVYTVHWVAVSTDSHRSQGEYKFTVK
ncbi:MAG TPA: copper homeostasis periplasmic binding protein CopC [Bryobacteraceae bacterium]|nr:copper homeostasis periplasmic binding protein CopC [Bryobacteraceae bacterium]